MPAGAGALETHGALLPEATLDAIKGCRVALKGPITTPVGTGFRSVNVALRQSLDLFAAVRPARSLPGVKTRHSGVDLVVVRENTEDLYQGIEYERGTMEAGALRHKVKQLGGGEIREDSGITVKPISVSGTRRIVRFAFEYARTNGRRKVTAGHKANVMRYSDGLFLSTAKEIAAEYGDVPWEDMQIDHLSARLARHPSDFDVLLLPNLYGDIISDLCAGLVGGLGLIPGANIGWEYAVFEPVHGSAPDIAAQGLANPIAMILSFALMLRHLGELQAASRVESAVDSVLQAGHVRGRDRRAPPYPYRGGQRRPGLVRGPRGPPTGAPVHPSAAGLAVVAAATVAKGLDPVLHQDDAAPGDGKVGPRPVGEEVAASLASDVPEAHQSFARSSHLDLMPSAASRSLPTSSSFKSISTISSTPPRPSLAGTPT